MDIRLSIVSIVFFILSSNAQKDIWCYINTHSGDKYKMPNEVFQAVDNGSGNLSFILNHRKLTKYCLIDNDRKIVSEFNSKDFTKKADRLIESSLLGNNHVLFFKNQNNSLFDRIEINYENKTINTYAIDLDLKGEYLIETFKENNQIYLLSIEKNSSILKLYQIELDGRVNKMVIDLSLEKFKKYNGLKTTLYYLITNKRHISKTISSRISFNVPNAIERTSAINKVYFKNGIITITNDNVSSETNIIQIDTKDGKYNYFQIPKKGFLKKELRSESNSFILDNFYFSTYVTLDKLVFAVYDLEKKVVVNEFYIEDNESISFKNTPVIIAKDKVEKNKNTKNSNLFLRHLVNSNVGISAYQKEGFFVVSIGGSMKEQSGTITLVGGLVGGIAGAILLSSFESYTNTKSTRVDCLFDSDFNHVQGEIPVNGFDKLKEFIKDSGLIEAPLQTLFEYDNNYIWGNFNKNNGVYELYKFSK